MRPFSKWRMARRRGPSKKVAASYHQPDLDALLGNLGDLGRQAAHAIRIDPKLGPAGEHLAAQLENDALVLGHGGQRRIRTAAAIFRLSPQSKRLLPL